MIRAAPPGQHLERRLPGENVCYQEPWHRRAADQHERDGPGVGQPHRYYRNRQNRRNLKPARTGSRSGSCTDPRHRPRSVLSATRLSSIHGLPAADSRVLAAWEPARGASRAPERAIFIVTNGPSAAKETGKTGTVAVAGCQRRFLSAGQRPMSRNLRCHGTAGSAWPAISRPPAPADLSRQPGHRHACGPAATLTRPPRRHFRRSPRHREHCGATVSTNRRSRARNVRFYVLILSVVFMLILSDREHPATSRSSRSPAKPSLPHGCRPAGRSRTAVGA